MKHTIDATNKPLGRLASDIAEILQGKRSPAYDPRKVGDDEVEVLNVEKMAFTGNKFENKIYYKHTGYMGHLRTKTLREAFEKDPVWVLQKAVSNMLPKNKLRKRRMKKLHIEK